MGNMLKAVETEMQVIENETMENKDEQGGTIFSIQDKVLNNNKADEVARDIINYLQKNGDFYMVNGDMYFFYTPKKQLIKIDKGHTSVSDMLYEEFKILKGSHYFINTVNSISGIPKALKAKETTFKRSSYYDDKTNTVYLSLTESKAMKITESGVSYVNNGTDNVLFSLNRACMLGEIEYKENNQKDDFFNDILGARYKKDDDSDISIEDRKLLLFSWIMTFFFPSINETKMIALFIGGKGSGKTTMQQNIGNVIFGGGPDGRGYKVINFDTASIDAITTNKTMVAYDNAEAMLNTQDLDKLASISTGGGVEKRALYTTNDMLSYDRQCNLSFSAMNPNFRRKDIAQRTLLFELEKPEGASYSGSSRRERSILNGRDEYVSFIIDTIMKILGILKIHRSEYEDSFFRMADFATFTKYVFEAISEDNEPPEQIHDKVEALLEKLTNKQDEYSHQTQTLPLFIKRWLESNPPAHCSQYTGNSGRRVTSSDLHVELIETANRMGMKDKYSFNTPKSLSLALSASEKEYIKDFDMKTGKTNGRRTFQFFMKENM